MGARAEILEGEVRAPSGLASCRRGTGFLHIPVTARVAQASARVPWHHHDPFDRLLVSQVMDAGLQLVTRDAFFMSYGIPVLEA
jgi:PIN domain nuclease of toxin-antitoxin system